jgi:YD repeat-containing protein
MAGRTTQFFYDAVGNRTEVIDPDRRTTYYTYDKVNRLKGISVSPDSKSADYYFDAIGNITREIKPNSAVTYYEYDDAGRLTKLDNRKSDLSFISSFEYDRDKACNITKCHCGVTHWYVRESFYKQSQNEGMRHDDDRRAVVYVSGGWRSIRGRDCPVH